MHLLMCNISNQARSKGEDAINRPWRPLPSGRLTEYQAISLRWKSAIICLLWSISYGWDMTLVTGSLIFTTLVYDELGAAGHVIGKNLCNIGGYTTFEIGAAKLVGECLVLHSNITCDTALIRQE